VVRNTSSRENGSTAIGVATECYAEFDLGPVAYRVKIREWREGSIIPVPAGFGLFVPAERETQWSANPELCFQSEKETDGKSDRVGDSYPSAPGPAFPITIEDLVAGLAGDPNSLQSSAIG
jgi:hypothetical protein